MTTRRRRKGARAPPIPARPSGRTLPTRRSRRRSRRRGSDRLDPENRPEGSEVDNTNRTFDEDEWKFDDDEGGQGGIVDPAEPASERGHGPSGDGNGSGSSDKSDADSGDKDSDDDSKKESESKEESDEEQPA